jgi:hypothetical protein
VDAAPAGTLLGELAEDLAAAVARRYQVSHDEAVTAILDEWSRCPALLATAGKATRPQEVTRTRAYRDAATAAKKSIYYGLRRYRPGLATAEATLGALARLAAGSPAGLRDPALRDVAAGHVSTAERLPHLTEFFERVVALAGVPETIVDVGCGVLPVLAPLDDAMRVTREYWALDKDPAATGALREYARIRADGRVRPVQWSLAQGWAAAHDAGLPRSSELGLLLKVVPVVARQSSAGLAVLAQTPARRLLVSGSRMAMAKRQEIERRETRILRRFFADHGLAEIGGFRTPDEIAFLVQRP